MAKWKQTRGREPSRERLINQPLCNTDRQSVTSHRESYIGREYRWPVPCRHAPAL